MATWIIWDELKELLAQEITQIRLPIDKLESTAFTSLLTVIHAHNAKGSPIFKRWNGSNYFPENIPITSLPIQSPFAGLEIPEDADKNLDNPIAKVYSKGGQVFKPSSYEGLIKARNENAPIVTAVADDGQEYIAVSGGFILEGTNVSNENLYATVGNVLYLYPSQTVDEFNFSYYYTLPYPTHGKTSQSNDKNVLRVPISLQDFIKLQFKQDYLAQYGQRLDFTSQRRLKEYYDGIVAGD